MHNTRNRQNEENDQQQQFSQTKKEYRCYICGDRNHPISECPKKGTPKTEWFITKAMKKMQHTQNDDASEDDDTSHFIRA